MKKIVLSSNQIRTSIIELLTARSESATICPSEVLSTPDRKNKILMEKVREVAFRLSEEKIIEITQKGVVSKGPTFKGPIRLRFRK